MKTRKALPVEVIGRRGQASADYQAGQLGNQVSTHQLGAVGGVAQAGNLGFGQEMMPSVLTAICANTTSTAKTFAIFDVAGYIAQLNGASYTAPTWGSGLSNAQTNDFIRRTPVIFTGFNYRITTGSTAQFDNPIRWYKGNVMGGVNSNPLPLGQFQRNTQQNQNILTVDLQIPVDQYTALIFTLNANTSIALDFSIGKVLGAVVS